jgi:hypothetical protein
MKILALMTATGLCLLSGCAHYPGATAPWDIPAHRLQAHMEFLADDLLAGRMTGTDQHRIAAKYVEAQFRHIGLQAGSGQSFQQWVPLRSSTLNITHSSMRLQTAKGQQQLKWKEDFVLYPRFADTQATVNAPLVFAGYGIVAPDQNHNDNANLDVEGKIVVILSRAPKSFPADQRAFYAGSRHKATNAAERGAVGLISIRNHYQRAQKSWDDAQANAGLEPSMRWTDDQGQVQHTYPSLKVRATLSDAFATKLFSQAGEDIEALLQADDNGDAIAGFAWPQHLRLSAVTRSQHESLQSPNVLARLPGTDPTLAGEHLVLIAHLDHLGTGTAVDGDSIYNGAYDNAMGVSLLIETARTLARQGTKRSVLFAAVTAEERGLLGSDYLAHHPPQKVEGWTAAISLDMPLLLFPIKEVIGFGAEHSDLGQPITAAAQAEGLSLAPDPLPDEVLFVRSDHYAFVRLGVPGLFFFPGFASADPDVDGEKLVFAHLGQHYHQPSDDMTRPVHWPSAETFARVNARLARAIANREQPPQWAPNNFFAEQFLAPE